MKKFIYLLSIYLVIILSSCENLDRELITTLTEKQVGQSYDNVSFTLASVYTKLPSGFLYIDGAMMASASDEAEHTLETSAIQKFNTGSWNSYTNPDDVWANYFMAIHKANNVLKLANQVNLDIYKLDPTTTAQFIYKARLADIKRWTYESRFLRAFFYFELVKRYGGVPILKNVVTLQDDFKNIKRDSLATCIKFISEECDSAAANLPAKYAATDLGRATSGAALALKSRVLLYAASDLFNNNSWAGGYSAPELISLQAGDRNLRWKAAADAAKAVIDLTGTGYALHPDYKTLFATYDSPEIILVKRASSTNTFELANFPIGNNLGQSGTTPTQNLVDAYEMTDGTKFNWNNPVQSADPYSNRDPRLNLSILTNNSLFKGRNVESWTGGKDGKPLARATRTGYYLRKYQSADVDLLLGNTVVHNWILIRLAEVYLNYAEALNEYDPTNTDIKKYVDLVRQRNGILMPVLPANLTQLEMRERIRNERRVEFAFEDQRIWDVRRWMIAPETLGGTIQGVNITKTSTAFTYTKIDVENRVFESKMYFYPIPQSELSATGNWSQNPLW